MTTATRGEANALAPAVMATPPGATPIGGTGPPVPPSPRSAAAAAGLAGAGAGQVTDLSRSHLVHRVDTSGGSCVVKRLDPGRVQQGRSLQAELFVYRLAGWLPELAAVLPRPLLVDERRHVLVLEAADPARTGAALLDRGALPTAAAARLLGKAMGAVHAATRGVPLPRPASSGVLELSGTRPDELLLTCPAARELAGQVAAEPVLGGALREGAARWTPSCLVHADVKWDNCLLDDADPAIRLIDWELAGSGDPAWDVACGLAQATALSAGGASDPNGWGEVGPLVEGYAEVAAPDADFWRRCAWYWPARVVHLALECAEAGGRPQKLLRAARELASTAADTGRELAGRSGP